MITSGHRDRAALAVLVLVLAVALLLDHVVASWATHARTPLLDLLVGAINPIGAGVTLLVLSVVLAAMTFASAGLAEFTLKHLVGRPRPDTGLAAAGLFGPSFATDIDSFPSGHATSVFAVAAVFAAYYPRLRWPLYGLAAAIALGRVYLERHYVSDIVAGAALGLVFAAYLYRKRRTLPRRLILETSP